jgi:C4-type Zn-finger protein
MRTPPKKRVPTMCPICGGKLRRWRQVYETKSRYRGYVKRRRYFYVCKRCNIRVVLHAHRTV